MIPPRVIGFTGSIGSGKSAVAIILATLGVPIIDADFLARKVVEPSSPALEIICTRFGRDLLLKDGSLDRRKLGTLIFKDEQARKELESLLHPLIRHAYLDAITTLTRNNEAVTSPFIAYLVPLLFESPVLPPYVSETVMIYAPKSICLRRVVKRDSLSYGEAQTRFLSQMDPREKIEKATYVLSNQDTIQNLEEKTLYFYSRLQ